jgi:hypothetical protein
MVMMVGQLRNRKNQLRNFTHAFGKDMSTNDTKKQSSLQIELVAF